MGFSNVVEASEARFDGEGCEVARSAAEEMGSLMRMSARWVFRTPFSRSRVWSDVSVSRGVGSVILSV